MDDRANGVAQWNDRILTVLSEYLVLRPDFIDADAMRALMTGCDLPEKEAFSLLLAAACGLTIDESADDRALYRRYFPRMVSPLDALTFRRDPYALRVKIPNAAAGRWTLKQEQYKAYEAFVCDDFELLDDGRVIPRIGFFSEPFPYPAALEDDRVWMTITPNEIMTMKQPIAEAAGKVIAFGLGLGYFAFMASEKEEVQSVTVIERSDDVIGLFQTYILPQFRHPEKIQIIHADAFDYAKTRMPKEQFDFAFVDLWHDVSDGLDLYLRMKEYEKNSPGTAFRYWIEKTLKCYL